MQHKVEFDIKYHKVGIFFTLLMTILSAVTCLFTWSKPEPWIYVAIAGLLYFFCKLIDNIYSYWKSKKDKKTV